MTQNTTDELFHQPATTQILVLNIIGKPAPKGSKGAIIRGDKPILFETCKNQKKFEKNIVTQTLEQIPETWETILKPQPITASLTFLLPKPKTKRAEPTVPPDIDKLTRNVLDALTKAKIWQDDGQVTIINARKRYATDREIPGVKIKIIWEK